ncbi:hypothetical protein PR202_ga23409 [Eleusine coracana subsp. coracana]|uniref:Uncharacterized protein n=1 Tax=Eleusine coracana subsp. coracana TaxID=191504 RepID=A0AAV5D549_ELECO|nr:hypothetical protein PR202_ga23409 [Eleusine coracana subsp. coracana]
MFVEENEEEGEQGRTQGPASLGSPLPAWSKTAKAGLDLIRLRLCLTPLPWSSVPLPLVLSNVENTTQEYELCRPGRQVPIVSEFLVQLWTSFIISYQILVAVTI